MQKQLYTIEEIKQAVDSGKTVYMENTAYTVKKDTLGQYLIVCSINNTCTALHGLEGTKYQSKLNGTNFYTMD